MQTRWISRLGWHTLLALVMLLMQQAGLRHSLQHASRDDGAPTHVACLQCLAHHASDHSAAPSLPGLLAATFEHVLTPCTGRAQCGLSVQAGYLSRAPPIVLA
jgi:streptomycin 6-kinase